jgi:hypothetical protein
MIKEEIHFGTGNYLNVQTSQLVTMNEVLTLVNGSRGPIELNIKIEADFKSIPEQYHEVFLNMMTSKYYNRASFGDNPFSQCVPPKKRKWWEFWKPKYSY